MAVDAVRHAADDRELVGLLRHQRHRLADAGCRRRSSGSPSSAVPRSRSLRPASDRTCRCARPAGQPDLDHGLGLARGQRARGRRLLRAPPTREPGAAEQRQARSAEEGASEHPAAASVCVGSFCRVIGLASQRGESEGGGAPQCRYRNSLLLIRAHVRSTAAWSVLRAVAGEVRRRLGQLRPASAPGTGPRRRGDG